MTHLPQKAPGPSPAHGLASRQFLKSGEGEVEAVGEIDEV
jgi:hypothetical protein